MVAQRPDRGTRKEDRWRKYKEKQQVREYKIIKKIDDGNRENKEGNKKKNANLERKHEKKKQEKNYKCKRESKKYLELKNYQKKIDHIMRQRTK